MAGDMTPEQLTTMLGFVPKEGLANLTDSFSSEQLQSLVTMLPPEGIVNLTKTVPPAQVSSNVFFVFCLTFFFFFKW